MPIVRLYSDNVDITSQLPPVCYLPETEKRVEQLRGFVAVLGSDFNAQVYLFAEPEVGPSTPLCTNNTISRRIGELPGYGIQVQGDYVSGALRQEFNPIGGIGPGLDFLVLDPVSGDQVFVGTMVVTSTGAWGISDVQRQVVFELAYVPQRLQVVSDKFMVVCVREPSPRVFKVVTYCAYPLS